MKTLKNRWMLFGTLLGASLAGCSSGMMPSDAGDAQSQNDGMVDARADVRGDTVTMADAADVTMMGDSVAADVTMMGDSVAADVTMMGDSVAADVTMMGDSVAADVTMMADAADVTMMADAADVTMMGDSVAADVTMMADAADVTMMADAADGGAPLTCPSAVRALSLPMDMAMGTTMGTSSIPSASCARATGGPEHVYTLHVGARTNVEISTDAMFDSVLSIRRNCADAMSEVACDDDSGRGTSSLIRTALDPGDYFVIVDQYGMSGMGGAYTLSLREFTPAPNATCASAVALTPGTAAMGDTFTGGEPATTCRLSDSPQLFYTLTIPAGHTATVTASVTGTRMWTPVVRLLDSCTATSCLASGEGSGPGMPASASFDNRGSSERTIVVSVSSTTPEESGTFSLMATVTPLPAGPYTESSIPTSCQDMSAATVVSGVDGDDTASAIAMLPFTFSFMGESVTHYSVTSNGFAQLWTSMTGTPSTSTFNTAIPTMGGPERFIAPLWDDLDIPAMAMTDVRVLTVGTAPNRTFVIQWTNWSFFGDDTARLTFQAKLFETTNVIEFHYCTLTPGTDASRATGGSATVGVENGTGTRGYQHSYNMAGSISTMNAIRLTPAP